VIIVVGRKSHLEERQVSFSSKIVIDVVAESKGLLLEEIDGLLELVLAQALGHWLAAIEAQEELVVKVIQAVLDRVLELDGRGIRVMNVRSWPLEALADAKETLVASGTSNTRNGNVDRIIAALELLLHTIAGVVVLVGATRMLVVMVVRVSPLGAETKTRALGEDALASTRVGRRDQHGIRPDRTSTRRRG